MKCRFFLQARTSSIVDINKNLSHTKQFFPNAKIERKKYAGYDFVIINNCISDVIIDSIRDIEWGVELNLDFYTTSLFGHSFLDLSFDIPQEMAKKVNSFLDSENLIFKSKIMMNDEIQSVSNLITTVLFKYFKMEEMIDLCSQEKYLLKNKREGMEDLRGALIEKMNANYFFTTDGPDGSISGSPGVVIIEDYNDEISADIEWEDVGLNKGFLFQSNKYRNKILLKKNNYYKDLHEWSISMCLQEQFLKTSTDVC